MQDNSSRPVVEPSRIPCRNAKARGFAGMSYNLSCSTSARMQLFALTTSHLGQFSERLRRVADIFSSFSRLGLHFPCTLHAGSSLKVQRAARGPDRSTARRPGPSVRGVATWRRQDIACFSGPTYTNPPQIRKRKVCVIFAPPNFQLRLDHFPWLEHRRSRCYYYRARPPRTETAAIGETFGPVYNIS